MVRFVDGSSSALCEPSSHFDELVDTLSAGILHDEQIGTLGEGSEGERQTRRCGGGVHCGEDGTAEIQQGGRCSGGKLSADSDELTVVTNGECRRTTCPQVRQNVKRARTKQTNCHQQNAP